MAINIELRHHKISSARWVAAHFPPSHVFPMHPYTSLTYFLWDKQRTDRGSRLWFMLGPTWRPAARPKHKLSRPPCNALLVLAENIVPWAGPFSPAQMARGRWPEVCPFLFFFFNLSTLSTNIISVRAYKNQNLQHTPQDRPTSILK